MNQLIEKLSEIKIAVVQERKSKKAKLLLKKWTQNKHRYFLF